jgi:hypothetical protein
MAKKPAAKIRRCFPGLISTNKKARTKMSAPDFDAQIYQSMIFKLYDGENALFGFGSVPMLL